MDGALKISTWYPAGHLSSSSSSFSFQPCNQHWQPLPGQQLLQQNQNQRMILNRENSKDFHNGDPSCEFGPNYNWIACWSVSGQLHCQIILSLLAFLGRVLDRYIKYMMWYITWRDIQLLFCFYAKLAQTSNVLINLEKNYFYTSTQYFFWSNRNIKDGGMVPWLIVIETTCSHGYMENLNKENIE